MSRVNSVSEYESYKKTQLSQDYLGKAARYLVQGKVIAICFFVLFGLQIAGTLLTLRNVALTDRYLEIGCGLAVCMAALLYIWYVNAKSFASNRANFTNVLQSIDELQAYNWFQSGWVSKHTVLGATITYVGVSIPFWLSALSSFGRSDKSPPSPIPCEYHQIDLASRDALSHDLGLPSGADPWLEYMVRGMIANDGSKQRVAALITLPLEDSYKPFAARIRRMGSENANIAAKKGEETFAVVAAFVARRSGTEAALIPLQGVSRRRKRESTRNSAAR